MSADPKKIKKPAPKVTLTTRFSSLYHEAINKYLLMCSVRFLNCQYVR